MTDGLRRQNQQYVSLRDAMNQLFADAFTSPLQGQAGAAGGGGQDSLPVNVYEDGERYYLQLLAPGVNPEAVEITAANGVLSIQAKQVPLARENWRPMWQEFSPGALGRQLRLPNEIDANNIEASYQHGILMITVPKAEHTKPRQIKVQIGK